MAPAKSLVQLLTPDELLACECLFGLAWKVTAGADGKATADEDAVFGLLLRGEVGTSLPTDAHAEARSLPDLARDVLAYDKTAFKEHTAFASKRFLPATDIEIHLQAFVDRATSSEDRQGRIANARGLVLEAVYFAIRTARSTGGRGGQKIGRAEDQAITNFAVMLFRLLGETSLGLSDHDFTVALKYAELPSELVPGL